MGLVLSGCQPKTSPQEKLSMPNKANEKQVSDSGKAQEASPSAQVDQVNLVTDKGVVAIRLYPEAAPETVKNFVDKAETRYYEGLIFHRVEDWVVQGGDPDGDGTGGGNMPTELSDKPFKVGSVGVARGGNIKISNDSQFFICTKDCSFLNKQYTNFGEVTEGMVVVNKIEIGDKIQKIETVIE